MKSTETREVFDDELHAINAHQNLWRTVLFLALEEAIDGRMIDTRASLKVITRSIEHSRDYFRVPNPDFEDVCNLAGLDPQAVRESACKQIAAARSAEELATLKWKPSNDSINELKVAA